MGKSGLEGFDYLLDRRALIPGEHPSRSAVMNSSDETERLREAILDRCRDAAYVRSVGAPIAGMAPRRGAAVHAALEELVAAGRIRMFRVASLAVYIAW